jgi:hypothetical protein
LLAKRMRLQGVCNGHCLTFNWRNAWGWLHTGEARCESCATSHRRAHAARAGAAERDGFSGPCGPTRQASAALSEATASVYLARICKACIQQPGGINHEAEPAVK